MYQLALILNETFRPLACSSAQTTAQFVHGLSSGKSRAVMKMIIYRLARI